MMKLTISDKGGPEREMFFDAGEISVGRAPGNTLMLPKPNVSKRHATIMFREGKVLLVDLKSTNGTYVNGRRITAPKEIAADDKVYIGDFTIRAVVVDPREAPQPEAARPPADTGKTRAPEPFPAQPPEMQRRATVAMPRAPTQPMQFQPESARSAPPLELDVEVVADLISEVAPPPIPALQPEMGDSGATPAPAAVPPSAGEWEFEAPAAEAEEAPAPAAAPQYTTAPIPPPPREAPRVDAAPRAAPRIQPAHEPVALPASDIEPARMVHSGLGRRSAAQVAVDGEVSDAHQAALRSIAERAAMEVFASVDSSRSDFSDKEWSRLSDMVMRLVESMQAEGSVARIDDPFAATQDILFEFTGLGPLEELLADETVRTVTVEGLGRVFVSRGFRRERWKKGFSSDVTLSRVVTKLQGLAGIPPDRAGPYTEGRLPDGTSMQIISPPLVAGSHVVVLERPVGSSLSPDDLVEAGVIDAVGLESLSVAMKEHRNVIVAGAPGSGKSVFLNALLKLVPIEERVVVASMRREFSLAHPDFIFLEKGALISGSGPGAGIVLRLRPDVVVLPDLEARDISLLAELALGGQKGIVASTIGSSAEHCLGRLDMMVSFSQPTIREDVAKALVRQSVDVIVVLGQTDDGRSRVVEMVEVDPSGDLRLMVQG